MAELTAQERLQPSLLDRLVDNAPDEKRESDDKRTLTKQALRQAVLRDLGWLFNATGYGQRVLGSDAGEYALMDVREILFTPAASAVEATQEGEGGERG